MELVYLEFIFVCIVSIFAAPKDCACPPKAASISEVYGLSASLFLLWLKAAEARRALHGL